MLRSGYDIKPEMLNNPETLCQLDSISSYPLVFLAFKLGVNILFDVFTGVMDRYHKSIFSEDDQINSNFHEVFKKICTYMIGSCVNGNYETY
jgi:hypothetical protein